MKPEKLMIIDGNSILNRAFYGLQGANMLSTSNGVHTNAVFGFLNILGKFLDEEKPMFLCVAFDLKAPTFRHIEFEGYKAKRKGMPPELAEQVPIIKEVLDAMNIKRLELEGYEADDIIGSISLCAENKGMDVVIITGDRDSLQLATEKTRIKMPVTRGGRTETDEYDGNVVLLKYGVTPEQFIDVKGLMGDQSDNIPGVPGIGEKTALELITRFKSIENIYENIDEVEKKSVKEKLLANKELAFMSKRIATIERNMPYLCEITDLGRKDYDNDRLYELFKQLEFKSLIQKYNLTPGAETIKKETAICKVEYIDNMPAARRIKDSIKNAGKTAVFYLLDKVGSFEYSLSGISFSWKQGEGYFIRLGGALTEGMFLEEFKDLFESCEIKKVGHDMKPLIVYLKWKGLSFRGLYFDTMIGAYIINPSNDSYNISRLVNDYMGISIEEPKDLSGKGKNFTLFDDMADEKLSSLAGICCDRVFGLAAIFGDMIESNGQHELYYDIELPLIEVLSDMEFRGFKVNAEGLREYSLKLDDRISKITVEIFDLAGEEFNINSPKQLGVILFEKLGLPVSKKTKTGYSTDAEVLEQLAPMHEVVAKILEYRQLVKLKSTYAEGLLNLVNPSTGRIHSSFNQTVTATGRISSTEPNLQNIPVKLEMGREIRKVFVPEDEMFLLSAADYSQIELRVLAHITDDENMIKAFKNNEDIHTATAAGVFGIPVEQVTSLMRSRAKAVNFGIVYGIGDFSLAKDLGITRKEARKYIDDYLDRYPGVKRYMQETVAFGKENGFVSTLLNRRRYLPELKSSNFNIRSFGERVAMNAPIQGSAADIIKIAMVRVYEQLSRHNMKSRLILQVHDELIIETFIEEKELVDKVLRESMEKALELKVPLCAEVKSGRNWYETK
jgi:DNA polymerase I